MHFRSAGLMIVVGTLTGAFGAHALDGVLPEQSMGSFEVASRYLLIVGAALMGALASGERRGLAWVQCGSWLFSISIFLLVAGRHGDWNMGSVFGPLTPIGGLMMIVGWSSWVIGFGKGRS